MKLSKKTGLVIGIGIFVIALAYLFMTYSGRTDEQKQLNEQLASAQSRLSGIRLEQLSSQQAELEKQLSQATSQFEAAKSVFSELAGNTTAISIFFKVAKANGVEVTEVKSPGPAEDTLEGLACWVTPLTAKVKGELPSLVSFFLELNDYLETGVIKSLTTGENASAEIQLVIYTYRGD